MSEFIPTKANSRGHQWKLDADDSTGKWIDTSATWGGMHSGPTCIICGYTFCQHCAEGPREDCPGPDPNVLNPQYGDLVWHTETFPDGEVMEFVARLHQVPSDYQKLFGHQLFYVISEESGLGYVFVMAEDLEDVRYQDKEWEDQPIKWASCHRA